MANTRDNSKNKVSPEVLITTYNHYINNSLTKVCGGLNLLEQCIREHGDEKNIQALEKMSEGINEVVTFLKVIRDMDQIELQEYIEGYEYIVLDNKEAQTEN